MDKSGTGADGRPEAERRNEVEAPRAGGDASGNHAGSAESEAINGDVEQSLPDRARIQEYFTRLSPEERQLLLLRDELYYGSWEDMEADLRHRLERKPYIFRLMNRIEDDLVRIGRLRSYEEQYGVNLGVFLRSVDDDR